MLSRRTLWHAPLNRLAVAVREARGSGAELLDLTESNPTRVGIPYPDEELAAILSRAARHPYEPEALGLLSAREAIAAHLSAGGEEVSPDDLVLTASTSEAYSQLFKLLANPGDEVVTHSPSYPLLDHLAELEAVHLRRFPLHSHGAGWELDTASLAAVLSDRTRATVLIHPNNPTGSCVTSGEADSVAALLAPRDIPVICDEVFLPYPLAEPSPSSPFAHLIDLVSFTLGGLSKEGGLPHWKLGWIRIGGPAGARREIRNALELIADSFLSVSGPVQRAVPDLLPLASGIRDSIRERIIGNLAALEQAVAGSASINLLHPRAGWSAVLRVPTIGSDEELAIDLLTRRRVLVHPGYFFDFSVEGIIVISLLPTPDVFAEGVRRIIAHVEELVRP